MAAAPPLRRLRIAVIGLSGAEAGWIAQLGGGGVDVVQTGGPRDLRSETADLAVMFASPEEAASMMSGLGGAPPVPLAVFVGAAADGPADPRARLLNVLLTGKREWERTFDAIVDPVMVVDGAGRVTRANLQLARAVGRGIQDVIGHSYASLLGPAVPGTGDRFGVGAVEDPIADSLRDGRPREGEARYQRLPGLHEIRISPMGDLRDAGAVILLKDVSDRREHQERLLRSARLADIGQLAAGVAHEINTPLASIALRAESLMAAANDPRLQAIDSFQNFPRYLKTIDEEIFRCKRIIGALLDFSRTRRPEVRDTDLNQLAEKASDLVGHQIRLKQVGFTLHLDPALPHVTVDDGQLRQCVLALLMNALDATAAGGRIALTTRRGADGRAEIEVEDTGSGILPEHLGKIFTPFFTTKPVGQGTGLGLPFAHGIVTAHRGEIQVDSEVGRGTKMTISLPPSRPAAER
jgi:two-component system, NtrC family, sensor kinase